MPENAVKVDRSTIWGNPFVVGGTVDMKQARKWGWQISRPDRSFPTVAESLEMFKAAIVWDGAAMWFIRRELRGKDLACWCPLVDKDGNRVPCHADILLKIANT